MAHIFYYPLLIKEQHLDTFQHVNNAAYLEILEEARWDFLTECGYGLNKIHTTGMGPVVLECNLKFLKELRLREQIVVASQIISYEGKIGVIQQEIFREDKILSCQAKMTFGFFDFKKRKLVSPSPEWLEAMSGK